MAQKVNVMLVDDLNGSQASDTVTFGLDGRTYEIDLSEANAAKLRDTFAPYAASARRIGGRRVRRAAAPGTAANGTTNGGKADTATDRARTAAIRAWASETGLDVSTRGRIPNSVIDAYNNRDAQRATNEPASAPDPRPKEATAKKPAAKKASATPAPTAAKPPTSKATAPKKRRQTKKVTDPFNPEAATS